MTKKEYNKKLLKQYHDTRKENIEKLGGKCNKCNSVENLEFDHIDHKKKKFNISKIWYNKKLLQKELKKCQILCRECHKEKTKKDICEKFTKEVRHGTSYSYMKRKCRCEICKVNYIIWRRKLRGKDGNSIIKKREYNRITTHGDHLHYTRGCRCDICRKTNAEKVRNARKSKSI